MPCLVVMILQLQLLLKQGATALLNLHCLPKMCYSLPFCSVNSIEFFCIFVVILNCFFCVTRELIHACFWSCMVLGVLSDKICCINKLRV